MVKLICDWCGKSGYISPAKKNRTKNNYCSNECKYNAMRGCTLEEMYLKLHSILSEDGNMYKTKLSRKVGLCLKTLNRYLEEMRSRNMVEIDDRLSSPHMVRAISKSKWKDKGCGSHGD